MEACVHRGFANTFIPEAKVEVKNLQYIEDGELERAWKTARRQRVQQQEQKIWENFIQEQDILKTVLKEDPYQFLEQLPEAYLKELMEVELQTMKKEIEDETNVAAPGLSPEAVGVLERASQQKVKFAAVSSDDSIMFHIFSDKDESDPEEEPLNESLETPHTVRERGAEGGAGGGGDGGGGGDDLPSPLNSPRPRRDSARTHSVDKSQNLSNMIESSIYCAKVKELRIKINEELLSIITSLENQDVINIDPSELKKICKRAIEFCGRFQRIHLYQLHRQMHDIKRHSSQALPFAKHTLFQSQMVRLVSLHHSLLQAFQVFHKSVEQTACLRESGGQLRALLKATREARAAAALATAPAKCLAAATLCDDDVELTCDKVEAALLVYDERVLEALTLIETSRTSGRRSEQSSKKSEKGKPKKKTGTWSKSTLRTEADGRLSMYSLETTRTKPPSCPSSRDVITSGGTSKARVTAATEPSAGGERGAARPRSSNKDIPLKGKKSPRMSRRPLMRAPQEGRPRRRPHKDCDIHTMVEAVDATAVPAQLNEEGASDMELNNINPTPPVFHFEPPHLKSGTAILRLQEQVMPSSLISCEATPRVQPLDMHDMLSKTTFSAIKGEEYMVSRRSPRSRPSPPAALSPMRRRSPAHSPKYSHSGRNTRHPRPQTTGRFTGQPGVSAVPPVANQSPRPPVSGGSPRLPAAGRSPRPAVAGRSPRPAVAGRSPRPPIASRGPVSGRSPRTVPRALSSSKKPLKSQSGAYTESTDMVEAMAPISLIECAVKECIPEGERRGGRSTRDSTPRSLDRQAPSSGRDTGQIPELNPTGCEVTRLLRQLCGGDASGNKGERVSGAKNAQLVCVTGSSPRQPSTPQLLKILEETIQKKVPKSMYPKPKAKDVERFRLNFNITPKVTDHLLQYRTKFVQHMLTSSMYANSAIGKPWEMIGSVSEDIIDELLMSCAKEMEIQNIVQELYRTETQ